MPRMISRVGAVLGLLGLLGLSATGDARADFTRNIGLCGGSTFSTCASVVVTYSQQGTAHYLTIGVKNLSGLHGTSGSTVFTAIGLSDLPAGLYAAYNGSSPSTGQRVGAVTGPTRASNRDPVNNWAVRNDHELTGIGTFDILMNTGVGAYGGREWGIASNCDPTSLPDPLPAGHPSNSLDLYMSNTCEENVGALAGAATNDGFVNIKFRLSGALTEEDLAKMNLTIVGVSEQGQTFVATPEPVSMLLLGTGLAGIGGVAARRRRSRREEA